MYKRYLLASAIVALAACSNNHDSSDEISSGSGGSMSGVAAKGLINNGIATAYRIDDECGADDNLESNDECVIGSDHCCPVNFHNKAI